MPAPGGRHIDALDPPKLQLKVGGRLVAIVGTLPVMSAQLVTRTGDMTFNTINLFETVAPALRNAAAGEQFTF